MNELACGLIKSKFINKETVDQRLECLAPNTQEATVGAVRELSCSVSELLSFQCPILQKDKQIDSHLVPSVEK